MSETRTIRVRVRGGRLEPLEDLSLPEGSETTVTVVVPASEPRESSAAALRSWDLGLGARQITREDVHGDDY